MTEVGEDQVQLNDEAGNQSTQNSDISKIITESEEFKERSTHIGSNIPQPIPTEEDNMLQAAYTVLFTVPRAFEQFIDREYKGGFLQAILDYKDQLKTKLRSEEWDKLSQLIVHHRLFHFYDQIIQDTILDNEVLDLLISKCILKKEDREEIEQQLRQSDRNKCILDLLIQRPQESYSVLLEVLKECHTCFQDLIECMEGQLFPHHKVVSQTKDKSYITGFHSVRLQKNYHNLTQNLSNTESIIDSLISRGVLDPDDRAEIVSSRVQAKINRKLIDKIKSEQDYIFFLEALNEDPTNSKLTSDLESTDVKPDELKLLQRGTIIHSLQNSPGFQTLVILVSMVKDVQILDTEPERHHISLSADLYRLQYLYKKMLKMTIMDSHQYQQFVQTVNEILVRIGGDPVEIKLDTGMQKLVKKLFYGLKDKEEHLDLKEKIKKMETELEEVIPKNIRDQIKKQIEDWEKKDEIFVTTRASDYVIECLQDNSCLTLTAPSGVGKSFIARHTALVLQKEGYTIVPVRKPDDIGNYYQPGKQTVFIVDDICGNFTANQQQIETWQQLLPVINTIIADISCKIIVSCRLQVYKDDKFNVLVPFKSCECNLMSDKLCLTTKEKNMIAKTYIGSSLDTIDKLSQNSEFFPLLCYLCHKKKPEDVKEFFKNPFIVYRNELDSLSGCGVEGKYKICSLALLVLFNNQLPEKWLNGKVTDEQRHIIEDTCEACRLRKSTPKAEIKEAIFTLDGTFVYKQNGIYKTVHDKMFDFLAHYFGQKMIECLIDHGDSDLVHERFIWRKLPNEKNSMIEFIIEIPDDYLEAYFERFIKDWSEGKVVVIFCNQNMQMSLFRQQLLQHLKQLRKSKQITLANTKGTVVPKNHHVAGTTALIIPCCYGYTDIVQWILHNDADVDQCRDDGVTALHIASQEGQTNVVKLLLERNPSIDLCANNGGSSLFSASQHGHTNIVRMLLERNPNVDLCNTIGCCPLSQATQNGHTDIVKLLLNCNPNVDLCDNNYGYSPL
ncbi:uncharacterized protein [Mytilus edulis]|uniref:uncharacterized protein n=1 Tax=Mytilus edulis TaxID=6550 RepID=UPI0039F104A1